jgi:Family of unknown function (DUF6879)
MGTRITSVTSPAFDELFRSFKHTAYRLETLQAYDVSYEIEPYRAFLAGRPRPQDASKNAWTAMLAASAAAGKIVQRVHLLHEPLTDYLRYELEWSYPPNIEAGEDIRILPASQVPAGDLSRLGVIGDYWLFDSSDLWVMSYNPDGAFRYIEQVSDPGRIVARAYWRDAALHYAIPYADYMRRRELLAAS